MKRVRLLQLLRDVPLRFYHDAGFYHAAAIAFYALLSTLPLFFVLVTVFGYLLDLHEELYHLTITYLTTLYPHLDASIVREVEALIANRRLGGISFLVFLWTATLLFTSMEFAFHQIFHVPRRRHFLVTTLVSLLMVALLGGLILLTFLFSWLTRFLQAHPVLVGGFNLSAWLMGNPLLVAALPVAVILTVFTWLYKILPNRPIPFLHAFLGGALAALAWQVADRLFTWYVHEVVDYGSIYGSLATAIVLPLWAYYLAVILLLGAELVAVLERSRG